VGTRPAGGARGEGERLASRAVFGGRILDLRVDRVRMPNGKTTDMEVVRHPGASAVAALDDEGRVLLVRQYRYATGEWLEEVPAGKLDAGEPPEECARRELQEETGFRAGDLTSLGWIWTTPGFTDEKIHLFLATGLEPTRQALEDDEVLSIHRLPLGEAVEKALTGEIRDAKSVCCLLRASRRTAGASGAG
jgi:ADP-ribose pyrophosphatase